MNIKEAFAASVGIQIPVTGKPLYTSFNGVAVDNTPKPAAEIAKTPLPGLNNG